MSGRVPTESVYAFLPYLDTLSCFLVHVSAFHARPLVFADLQELCIYKMPRGKGHVTAREQYKRVADSLKPEPRLIKSYC